MSKQPKMSVCRNCNAPIGKNARICPSCGAKEYKTILSKMVVCVIDNNYYN